MRLSLDFKIFENISGCVYLFYIIHPLAGLNILDPVFYLCGNLAWQKAPSWTFVDPQMDPAKQILGIHCKKRPSTDGGFPLIEAASKIEVKSQAKADSQIQL